MAGITVAEFAKIKNVTPPAVHKAIASGRLVNCLIKDPRYKKPRLDPVVAAQEWEKNTDHNKRNSGADLRRTPRRAPHIQNPEGPAEPAGPTSREISDNYKADLLRLEYEKKAGLVVNAEAVEKEWFKIITTAKTKILSLPSKAKNVLPHLTNADIAALDKIVREILEDLAHADG